jgi:hypothetical protein
LFAGRKNVAASVLESAYLIKDSDASLPFVEGSLAPRDKFPQSQDIIRDFNGPSVHAISLDDAPKFKTEPREIRCYALDSLAGEAWSAAS